MNLELIEALKQLEKEKGIDSEVIFEAITDSLLSYYKKNLSKNGNAQNVVVNMDRETGKVQIVEKRMIVEEIEDPQNDILLDEAREENPEYKLGDVYQKEVTPKDFGRVAAQTVKQSVIQKVREAERDIIYEEFINKEGDIVSGIVQRIDAKAAYVDLGKIEALLLTTEQMATERLEFNQRIKAYVNEVKKTTKGPQVLLSRTHPGLLKRLFEFEVPEIHEGVVEIKSIAREAGERSKIAVASNDDNVDPVGACVGPRGVRVQSIVDELKGEKIDIVKWNSDTAEFIKNALSPSNVLEVTIFEDEKKAMVVVPDYQLSLAIGKEGQNARLAAKLTNWKIDIKSESQLETEEDFELDLESFDADDAEREEAAEVEELEIKESDEENNSEE